MRLKIGERIFERRAALVEDPEEWNEVLAAFAEKLTCVRATSSCVA